VFTEGEEAIEKQKREKFGKDQKVQWNQEKFSTSWNQNERLNDSMEKNDLFQLKKGINWSN
jgi:uncharacterized protein YaiL (DUF2058 family)